MRSADQFLEVAVSGRTPAVLDAHARKLWRAHAEGQIKDADAEELSEAIEARRTALVPRPIWPEGRPWAS